MSRKALILGISGMVGRPLAEALASDGWEVRGASRFSHEGSREEIEDKGIECLTYDVLTGDPATLPDVDVVFLEVWDPHTWGADNIEYVWGVNFYGIGRVVERYAGVADIVNGCTINVYGDMDAAATEDTPCRPTSEYGRSRVAQERLIDYFCVRGGRGGAHVRYARSNSVDRGVVRHMAESILKGESLGAAPDSKLQVVGIEDFVRVTVGCADRMATPPTAVNCTDPHVWTTRELADAIQAQLGRGTVVFDRESGGVESSAYVDVSRMLDWFGEPLISQEELIGRVASALKEEDA